MMASIPLCALSSGVGGCVDYQMRMVMSPLTGTTLAVLLLADLKWKMPLYMMFPYLVGRAVTAAAPSIEVQVFCATPLLALGYAWAAICYASEPVFRAQKVCLLTVGAWCFAFAARDLELLETSQANDMAQVFPFFAASAWSGLELARNGAWVWLIGLVWGMLGPLFIAAAGASPYESLRPPVLSGPRLWYSDGCVTMPLVFTGMLLVAIKGRPELPGSWPSSPKVGSKHQHDQMHLQSAQWYKDKAEIISQRMAKTR